MKKILFLAKFGHDLAYFRSIKNYINSRGNPNVYADLMFNLPIFFFELFGVFKRMPVNPKEMADILKYEITRKLTKYNPFKAKFLIMVLMIIAKFYYLKYRRILRIGKYNILCVFGGFHVAQKMAILASKELGIKVFHFENGVLPNTTTMDAKGTNFMNSVPRNLSFFKSITQPFVPASLIPRLKKHEVIQNTEILLPKKYIFCPFQVALDTQVLLYSPWIHNMEDFHAIITKLCENTDKDLYFIIKEHPSCFKKYPHLHKINNLRIIFANYNNTEDLIKQAEAVLTINSTIGIEAIMLNKKVITLGDAFYSGYGLAKNATNFEEILTIVKNLEEWQVSPEENLKFLSYLQNFYLIPQSWQIADARHFEAVYQRLIV
jgi:capsular polysaccharide export protein